MGITVEEFLNRRRQGTDDKPPEEAPPEEPPYQLQWQWYKFLELDRRRQSTGYAPQPIQHSEIDCWSRLYGITLRPWEVRLFTELDDTYLTSWSDDRRTQQAKDRS